MQKELETAKTLAVRAGQILMAHYLKPSVQWKEPGNPVTDADRYASAFLVAELKSAFPEDGALSEEEPDGAARLEKSRVWIVDPMDGTNEFLSRNGEFSVMIGLAIEGRAQLGVVYQPTSNKLYYAATDSGAFLREDGAIRRLTVSPETDPQRMVMALSRSHPSPRMDAIRSNLGIQSVISSGSLGLKAGLICEGRAHVYLNTSKHTWEWDTCAADAILQEAGGRMTDIPGAPLLYNRPDPRNATGVIASNGVIHDRIVEAARAVLGSQGA